MPEIIKTTYMIFPSPDLSELENFAHWFHEDCDLDFDGPFEGARMYFESMDEGRKPVLQDELRGFLLIHAQSSAPETTKAWFDLGVGAWPDTGQHDPEYDVRPILNEFIRMLG